MSNMILKQRRKGAKKPMLLPISTGPSSSAPMRLCVSICRWLVACAVLIGLSTSEAVGQPKDSLDRDYAVELPRIPPTEPADALKTFHVAPGFRVEQVAAEPLVADPVA